MNDEWHERKKSPNGEQQRTMLILGVFLVLLGSFFLVSEQTNLDYSRYGWPLFIIGPGLLLLLLGLAIPHEGGLGAAVPGGIITAVGLLLAFQDATNTYASWAYAWALVAPGFVGATLTLYGLLHRRWELLDAGLRTAAVGLGLFVGFGLFFENIIGVDAARPNTLLRDALPTMAVALGVLIVFWNLMPARWRFGSHSSDAWRQVQPPDPLTPPTPPSPPAPPAS